MEAVTKGAANLVSVGGSCLDDLLSAKLRRPNSKAIRQLPFPRGSGREFREDARVHLRATLSPVQHEVDEVARSGVLDRGAGIDETTVAEVGRQGVGARVVRGVVAEVNEGDSANVGSGMAVKKLTQAPRVTSRLSPPDPSWSISSRNDAAVSPVATPQPKA
jgi:hypothetical protein